MLVALKLVDQKLRRVEQRFPCEVFRRAGRQAVELFLDLAARDQKRLVLRWQTRIVELLQSILDLRAVFVQLGLLRIQLRISLAFGRGKLRRAVGILLFARFELFAAFRQGLFRILELLAVGFDLPTRTVELAFRGFQLPFRVGALALILCRALVILLLRVRQRVACVVDDVLIAHLRTLVQCGGQRRAQRVDVVGIGLGIDRPVGILRAKVDLRKVIEGKRVLWDICKSVDAAAAEGGRAALNVQIQRRGTQADDREFFHGKAAVKACFRHFKRCSQNILGEAVRI